jgi:DNA polymerase III gamma/tau subunit
MQLNFKRVSEQDLIAGMDRICSKRGISVTKDALMTIALRADGSVRDALSILEQCIAAGDKTLDRSLVLEYTGAAGEDFFLALTDAVIGGDAGKINLGLFHQVVHMNTLGGANFGSYNKLALIKKFGNSHDLLSPSLYFSTL